MCERKWFTDNISIWQCVCRIPSTVRNKPIKSPVGANHPNFMCKRTGFRRAAAKQGSDTTTKTCTHWLHTWLQLRVSIESGELKGKVTVPL